MTERRSSQEAGLSVVIDPGPPPYTRPWDLVLYGPYDPAVVDGALGELTVEGTGPGRPDIPVRHPGGGHVLRLRAAGEGASAQADEAGAEGELTELAGRLADRLTDRPSHTGLLPPLRRAARTPGTVHGFEAAVLTAPDPLDRPTAERALQALVDAHPHLTGALADPTRHEPAAPDDAQAARDGGRGVQDLPVADLPRQDLLDECEFSDEAGFEAALRDTGRGLDAEGPLVRGLLAHDRRPGHAPARLALAVHEAAVDRASWHTLTADLVTLMRATDDDRQPRLVSTRQAAARWLDRLRRAARDPAENRHWRRVAERRAPAAGAARPPQPADDHAADDHAPETGSSVHADPAVTAHQPAADRPHTTFVLGEGSTGLVLGDLARRLGLTAEQVLTGVLALALADWQGTDDASFDVRSDPRAHRSELRDLVGRLDDPYPVHLTVASGMPPLERLLALTGALAAGTGRVGSGAGFGACREWSPDPLLRHALRELPPAGVRFDLAELSGAGAATADPGAGPVRIDTTRATGRRPDLEVGARLAEGCLHLRIEYTADGSFTAESVTELARRLGELLISLAEAPARELPVAFPATEQQASLYRSGDARPGSGRHVEQLLWFWHGPLDPARFAEAWQSVFDRETVLRTAFADGPEALLLLHGHTVPDIVQRTLRAAELPELLEHDRMRGFDLCRPGALRVTVLDPEHTVPGAEPAPTRILLTYHRAFLDNWSAHLLVRSFHRAYLSGGLLPGGRRRPDLRDYAAWAAAQDPEAAQAFWTRAAPPDGAASRPGRGAGPTGLTGVGRPRLRLEPDETARLAHWAAGWGVPESSVLQAVWALLIHRATGTDGPESVCFAVTVPGRGIALDGVARMPGPLRNALPMAVEVDPHDTLFNLLRALRDRALDMAAYEWFPGEWTRDEADPRQEPADTVIVFEDPPHPVKGLEGELAQHGIRAEFPGTLPARSGLPVALVAHHDSGDGLVLTGVHDRALLDAEAAAELLAQSVLLLRELPLRAHESTTVAQALQLLDGSAVPRMAETPARAADKPLVVLRAATRQDAGTICLVLPPGAPATCYDLLARAYPGPEELLVLTAPGAAAQSALVARSTDRPLALAGFSGAGAQGYDIARRVAAGGGRPPRVLVAGAAADEERRCRQLAEALPYALGPAGTHTRARTEQHTDPRTEPRADRRAD